MYTLMFVGLLSVTLTFLFLRYLSSILYGCLAPVFKSSVMVRLAPVLSDSFAGGEGFSSGGPMAGVVISLVSGLGGFSG